MKRRTIGASDLGDVVAEVGIHQLMDDMIVGLHKALRACDASSMEITKRSGFSYESPDFLDHATSEGECQQLSSNEVGSSGTQATTHYREQRPAES